MNTRPFMRPVAEYQADGLRRSLETLDWCDYHPDFVAYHASLWGATVAEAEAIVADILDELHDGMEAA